MRIIINSAMRRYVIKEDKMRKILFTFAAICGFFISAAAHADDFILTLKDNAFVPQELEVPANQKVKLKVKNLDATPAEFESHDLQREKIIRGNSEAVVFIGPLEPGRYEFFDEFHMDTTRGTIIVK
jgi:hypothetical protein